MNRFIACIFSLHALIFLFSNNTSAQVQILSATSTISSCPNNGTITVNATGSPPLVYSIVSGPVAAPEQTGNTFSSLSPGNYRVRVSDIFGNEDFRDVTINGSYTPLAFTPQVIPPTCPGGNDGQIIGNRQSGTGNGPFTWEIIAPAAFVRGPQESNTFTGLPPGDYTIRLTDNCGAYRTQVTTLWDNQETLVIERHSIEITGCNEAQLNMSIYPGFNVYHPPYTLEIETPYGVIVIPDDQITKVPSSSYLTANPIIPNLTYGDHIRATLRDNCNRTVTIENNIKQFVFCPSSNTSFTDCEFATNISFLNRSNTCNPGMQTSVMPPLTYELVDVGDGSIATSGVLTSPQGFGGLDGVTLDPVPGGRTYEITMTDGCGNVYTRTYNAPNIPTPSPPSAGTPTITPGSCKDSTASVRINTNNFLSPPSLVFLSGPSGVRSTKPTYEFDFNYTFPVSFNHSSSGPSNYYGFEVEDLAAGHYEYKIVDDCGSEILGSFDVRPEDLSDLYNDFYYTPGCLGNNKLHFNATVRGGTANIRSIPFSAGFNWSRNYNATSTGYVEDSVSNIPPGTYRFTFNMFQSGSRQMHGGLVGCPELFKVITIGDYEQPEIYTYNSIFCDNVIYAEIIPDSNKGVPPYQYEIIAGPETHGVQDENVFALSTPGTYTARIYDDCGNATTREIHLEELDFKPLTAEISCTSVRIVYPSSQYYSYEWFRPDNSSFTNDSLIIPSVTPADTGKYTVFQTVEISGCTQIFEEVYHIGTVAPHVVEETVCAGETYQIGSEIFNATGTYLVTLDTSEGCDSIVELHLTVPDYPRGTTSQTICPGGSYTLNDKVYTEPGIYSDTLSTATCDSIVTIEITWSDYIRGTYSDSICSGASVTINGQIYDSPGIYQDTIFTGTCDSIVTITILERQYLRGFVSDFICPGKQVTIGGNTFTEPGIYYDTLATSRCDSIVTITISERDYLRSTVNESICPGRSISIGSNTYDTGGVYYDTLSTASCDSIVTINITVLDYLRRSVYEQICPGEEVFIASQMYNVPGIYYDTLTNIIGCDSVLTITINESPLPVVNLGGDRYLCEGESYLLDASPGFAAYEWNSDAALGSNQTLSVQNSGVYWVKVLNEFGCTSSDTMEILSILPKPIATFLSGGQEICQGESIQLTATGGTQYVWVPENGPGGSITVKPEFTTTYTVTAIDNNNCTSLPATTTVVVKINPEEPIFNNSYKSHCFMEGPLSIGPVRGRSFLWSTGETTPSIQIERQGVYSVAIVNEIGCPESAEITIDSKCVPLLFVPDAFSPNNDGKHDYLEIFGKSFINFEMRIFNRWGEVIFLTNNREILWDGTFNGQPMPVGSYPWVIEYEPVTEEGNTNNKRNRITGSVTLIR